MSLTDLGRRGSECPSCARLFLGTPAFDAHRRGRHGVDRRCSTDNEMRAAGLVLDARGVWLWATEVGKTRQKPPARVAAPPGTAATRIVDDGASDAANGALRAVTSTEPRSAYTLHGVDVTAVVHGASR